MKKGELGYADFCVCPGGGTDAGPYRLRPDGPLRLHTQERRSLRRPGGGPPPKSTEEENSSQEDEIPPETAEPGSGTQAPTNQEGQASAPITQEEALALAENHFGEKDQATGNTFSIGFESMVTVDGVEYYNFRVSWLVNGDHMSYLTNYLVSLDGKERKEYLPQG